MHSSAMLHKASARCSMPARHPSSHIKQTTFFSRPVGPKFGGMRCESDLLEENESENTKPLGSCVQATDVEVMLYNEYAPMVCFAGKLLTARQARETAVGRGAALRVQANLFERIIRVAKSYAGALGEGSLRCSTPSSFLCCCPLWVVAVSAHWSSPHYHDISPLPWPFRSECGGGP
jgi:hypothetical protein